MKAWSSLIFLVFGALALTSVAACGGEKPGVVVGDDGAATDPAPTPTENEAGTTEPPAATVAAADAATGEPAGAVETRAVAAVDRGAGPDASGEAPADAEARTAPEPDATDEYALPPSGTIIREPEADTPEWLIQQALLAAMEPDEPTAWRQFEALLHTSEKIPNALISRRELNFPAMRRKVGLFLIEDPAKPIYKISYIEKPGPDQLKIFVHNPKSSPTPCYIRKDPEQGDKWRITTCSL